MEPRWLLPKKCLLNFCHVGRGFCISRARMALHNPVDQQECPFSTNSLFAVRARIALTSTPWKTTTGPEKKMFGKMILGPRYELYFFQNI